MCARVCVCVCVFDGGPIGLKVYKSLYPGKAVEKSISHNCDAVSASKPIVLQSYLNPRMQLCALHMQWALPLSLV